MTIYEVKLSFRIFKYIIRNLFSKKYFFEWLYYYKKRNTTNTIEVELPWVNFILIHFLKKYLNAKMHVFEWGRVGQHFLCQNMLKKYQELNMIMNFIGSSKIRLKNQTDSILNSSLFHPTSMGNALINS